MPYLLCSALNPSNSISPSKEICVNTLKVMIYFIYMLNNQRKIMYTVPLFVLVTHTNTLSLERDLNSRLVQRHMVKTFRETFQFMSRRLFPPRAHKIHEESNKKNQLDRVLYCAIYNVHNNIRYVHTQYSILIKKAPAPQSRRLPPNRCFCS